MWVRSSIQKKYFIHMLLKQLSNFHCQRKCRIVFSVFNGIDCLASYPCPLGQIFLAQSGVFTKFFDSIFHVTPSLMKEEKQDAYG